jgi:ectoine hydroxylase-related dioxygenase (phytanoyl-CoA dioxygenase family)
MGKTLLKFSVSWGRLSAFLSQDIEAKIELSLESKIAVSLALLGEQALEGSAHEFNNYFAAAVSAGRSEFTQAIEILYNGPLPDQEFWRSMNNSSAADVTISEITKSGIRHRIQNRYQKFVGESVNKEVRGSNSFMVDQAMEALHETGYALIPGLYSDRDILSARQCVLNLSKDEMDQNKAYQYGRKGDLQRVYGLPLKNRMFLDFLINQISIGVADRFFCRDTNHETYLLSSFQANILCPGAEAQQWHVDTALPSPLPEWPVRLNYNILLDDFTSQNGSTKLVPGSHHLRRNVSDNAMFSEIAEKAAVQIEAPRGSVLFWDGRLWHKSAENYSDSERVALLACFSNSILKELAAEEELANYYHDLDHHLSWHEALLLGLTSGRKQGGANTSFLKNKPRINI